MSAIAAEQKNQEDIERQVEALRKAYANAGRELTLTLEVEESTKRGHKHYRLLADGYVVTDWHMARSADVWIAILDMRRAVEVLDKR